MPTIRLADIPNAGPQALGPSNVGISAPSVPRFAVDPQAAKLTGAAMADSSTFSRGAKSMLDQTLELDAYSKENAAMGKIAYQVGQIGEVALAYSEKMAKAKDTADLARAETLMRSAFEKQQNDQMNTPVDKWQEKWLANVSETKKAIGEIGISNNAAQSLSPAFDRWDKMSGLQIVGQANKKRIEGYRQDIEANALMKIADEDYEGAFGIYDIAVKDGIFSQDESKLAKARLQDSIVRKAEADQANNITATLSTDPDTVVSEMDKVLAGTESTFGKIDASKAKVYKARAERESKNLLIERKNDIINAINSGDILDRKSLDAWNAEKAGGKMDAATLNKMERMISLNVPYNPEAIVAARTEIAKYDPATDDATGWTKYNQILDQIQTTVPKDMRERMMGELRNTWSATAREGKSRNPKQTYTASLLKTVEDLGKGGFLGVETGKDKNDIVVNQDKSMEYWNKVESIQSNLIDWLNDPKNKDASPEQASSQLKAILGKSAQDGAAARIMEKNKPRASGYVVPAGMGGVYVPPVAPSPTPTKSEDLINKGKAIKGEGKVTSYNFSGDPYSDSNSRNLIGAWNNRLDENSLAISPDIERKFKAAGIGKGDPVELTLADGSTVIRNWDDRTMQDEQATRKFGKPLTGRFDFHSPGGKQKNDGMAVVSFRKATNA
jgi:hypothetical protein